MLELNFRERTPEQEYLDRVVIRALEPLTMSVVGIYFLYLLVRMITWQGADLAISAASLLGAVAALCLLRFKSSALQRRFKGLTVPVFAPLMALVLVGNTAFHTLLGLESILTNVVVLVLLGAGLLLLDWLSFAAVSVVVLTVWGLVQPLLEEPAFDRGQLLLLAVALLISGIFCWLRRRTFQRQFQLLERQLVRKRELAWLLDSREAYRQELEELLAERTCLVEKTRSEIDRSDHQADALRKVSTRAEGTDLLSLVAHRVSEIFTQQAFVIRENLKVLRQEAFLEPFSEETLYEAENAVGKIEDLFGNLNLYAEDQPLSQERISLHTFLTRFATWFSQMCPETVIFELQQESEDLWVQADTSRLTQALLNLCLNSVEAMPHGGNLSIKARSDEGWILLEVTDTGWGIPIDDWEEIFNPFCTTHPQYQGRGLGLSVARGIVRQHGGELKVARSSPGGTTMLLTLPSRAPLETGETGLSRSALVLEQNPEEWAFLYRCLKDLGFTVVRLESLDQLPSVGQKQRLLLVDLNSLSGDDISDLQALEDRLRSQGFVVIGTTTGVEGEHPRLSGSFQRVLPKPFSLAAVRRAVAEFV